MLEVVIYSELLSDADRQKVDTYLAIKYGMTLVHDYFSSSYDGTNAASTTIYDVDNGYGNDVAGIGQESAAEGLSQTISKSQNDDAVIQVTAPTSLDDGEYLVWGNNDLSDSQSSDLPAGYDERLQRAWYFTETGDVGTVSMKFDLSNLGNRSENPDDYAILINNGAAAFSSADIQNNGATISNNTLTFTNVNIEDGDYLTLAVSSVRGPGAVSSGLNMWLKPEVVTLDGGVVDSWPDQSGAGNNADPVPFDRPTVESSLTVNGNPYLEFDDENGGQVNLPSISNQSSLLMVVKTSTNGVDLFEQNNNSSPMLIETSGGFYQVNSDGGFVSTTGIGEWNIVELINSAIDDHDFYIDGSLEDNSSSSIAVSSAADYNLLTNYTGQAAEVVYYEDELSDTERRQVESYLAIKYGITLDVSSQDYLDGSGSSIFDAATLTGYTENIAGIGRANADSGEDAQGLLQSSSQSINSSAMLSIGSADDLEDGEYLLWGSDNSTALASLTESAPSPSISGVALILGRKWRMDRTGDVGSVDVSFDLSASYYLGDGASGGNALTGNIAEVILYDQELSTSDLEKLETYLALKYGLTLAHDYYSIDYDGTNAASTTVYDISSYANDIAGISREDDESFLQVQSLSENSDAIVTVSFPSGLDDGEYLIWGNNDGTLAETTSGVPSGITEMLGRIWRVEETGDVGTVTLQFDVSGVSGVGTLVSDFSLLVDDDGTFSSGASIIEANDFTSDIVTFNLIDLADDSYFTLATSVSSEVFEISTTVGDYEVTSSCPNLSGSSYITLRDASDRKVAEINPNGNDLGATCWGIRVRASGDNSVLTDAEQYFVDRNYYFTPTTQPTTSVSVRLFVLDDEIVDIRANLQTDGESSGNDVDEYFEDFLRVTKRNGSDLDPTFNSGDSELIVPSVITYGSTGYQVDFDVDGFSKILLGTNSDNPLTPLPVTLASFDVNLQSDGQVKLIWSTSSEMNNDFYTIERSWNGVDFDSVGEVKGAGTTNQEVGYSFMDPVPLKGMSFYRLKQTDYDEAFSYSSLESLQNFDNDASALKIFPNPSTGWVTLLGSACQLSELRLFDLSGHEFTGQVDVISKSETTVEIDISRIDKGIYFLKTAEKTYKLMKE